MNTEVEINMTLGPTVDGKDTWEVELITYDDYLWTTKEPWTCDAGTDPDRLEIEREFFINRDKFELLGNYWDVKGKRIQKM